jgi:uncharacterized protein (UPF0335 family)
MAGRRKRSDGPDPDANQGGEGDEGGATEKTEKKVLPFRASKLKGWFKRWLSLMEDKRAIDEKIRTEVFGAAKADGYDPKIMKQAFKLRELDPAERNEDLGLFDTYLKALGIGPLFDRVQRDDGEAFENGEGEGEGDEETRERGSPAREMAEEFGFRQ